MLDKRMKVDTADIEPGMYVSQLDRPWLETPFFFQGFEIREDGEIALLRKFCRHVYIDVTRSTVDKKKVIAAHKCARSKIDIDPFTTFKERTSGRRQATLQRRVISALSRWDPTGILSRLFRTPRQYKNVVTTRKEAPAATQAYDVALEGMNEVLKDIRNGGGVNVDKVKEVVAPMVESVLRNQDAMGWLVYLRKRDEYTYNHSIASSVWALVLGRHLGFDRHALDTLAMGGVLLDIGKARIPESITMKTDPLTEEEQAIMRMHVDYGLEIAKITPGITNEVIAMVASHHERHDGSGYPNGLTGTAIPVFGRVAGLVDCYDAMTTNRPYAAAKSSYDAIRELNAMAGKQFQAEMVEQFVQALGMFPTGSLVELNTGEVGIVIKQNRIRRLRPSAMLLLDAEKQALKNNRILDLRKLPSDERNRKSRWIVQGYEAGAFGIDPKDYFM